MGKRGVDECPMDPFHPSKVYLTLKTKSEGKE